MRTLHAILVPTCECQLEGEEEVLYHILQTSTLRNYFQKNKKDESLNVNTWQPSTEYKVILPYLICLHYFSERKMSVPKKLPFNFRIEVLQQSLLIIYFSSRAILISSSISPCYILVCTSGYTVVHHHL